MLNFFVINYRHSMCGTALLIYAQTDVPCHLTCVYTRKKPLRHLTSQMKRGLDKMTGVYYCYDPLDTVEQFEAGDTIHHNFFIDIWASGKPGWYLFTGTIGGIGSPSISPIFEAFNPAPFPLTNGDFEGWAFPNQDPYGWHSYVVGPGTGYVYREDINVRTGLHSAKLNVTGLLTWTYLRQYFCCHHLRGKTVTFKAYSKCISNCATTIYLSIPGTGSWNLTRGPHGYWARTQWTFTVDPAAYYGWLFLNVRPYITIPRFGLFDSISLG